MTTENLRYLIESVWTGKSATASAKRDIESVGTAAKKSKTDTGEMTTAVGGMGSAFASLAAGGAIAAVGAAVVSFGAQSITAASDAEEAYGKFNVVFGQFAESTEADLEKIGDATGRSKYELVNYAATLQDTFVPLGFARDEAAKMSTQLTQLAIDLASFNNLETADVVRDLQSALVGNTETLRKYGVVAQETQIKEEALRAGLWDGVGAIDAQAKAQAILNLTLAGTVDAQGDAVRTADSYANKQREMEAAILDLKVAVGQGLLPAMVDVTNAITVAAERLGIFLDVAANGGDVINDIVQGNIREAQSIDDLIGQYRRIQDQQRAGLGLYAIMTGTRDDLEKAEQDVTLAILESVSGVDEYITVMRELGFVTNEVNESIMRDRYDEAQTTIVAAHAVEMLAKETAAADSVMLGYMGAAEGATTATYDYGWSLDGVRKNYEGLYQSGFAKFSDDLGEIERATRAAGAAFDSSFVSALESGEDIYGKWVTTATAMGGRTQEQESNFLELSSAAEKLRNNINSLQGGTAGLGLTQDELNEKLAEQYEQLALVEGALSPLAGIATTYSDVQKKWVVDADALNQQLFGQVTAMSDNAVVTAAAALALGVYDEAQVEAALNAAIIEEKIKALAEQFVAGEINAGQMKERLDQIVQNSPYTSELEVLTAAAEGAINKIKDKLDALDGRTITAKIEVITENKGGGPPPGSGGASDRGGGAPPAGGGAGSSPLPPSGPPPGGAAPASVAAGAYSVVNQTFISNTRESQALAWAQAEQLRRQRMDGI